MKKNIVKKGLVFGILMLFIGASVIPSMVGSEVEKHSSTNDRTPFMTFNHRGNVLYVGGSGANNYTKIQDAIDNASDGDTVFVYDDSSPYYENVIVDKSINLIGENRDTTIIDGSGSGDVVYVYADWVNISGFNVQNGDYGISVWSDFNIITGNDVSYIHEDGIHLSHHASGNKIIENYVGNSNDAIELWNFSDNNTISGNNVSDNIFEGVSLHNSSNNIISGNIISNNDIALFLNSSSNNTFSGNNISNNDIALFLNSSNNYNNISGNNILNNLDIEAYTPDASICLCFANHHNIISGNNITNNGGGIVMGGLTGFGNSYNIISGNIIRNNTNLGIFLGKNSHHNTISKNAIKDHYTSENGMPGFGIIAWDSSSNSVFCNNFIDNTFSAIFLNCTNTWYNNYWNRPRFLPKIILGLKIIWISGDRWIILPYCINLDWHPAREPYEI